MDEVRKRQTFRLGDTVRILSGPLTEFTGKIEGINQSKALLKVNVRIYGGNLPIRLSFADVKVVTEGREMDEDKKRQTFRLGDTVRILSGPLTEFTGKIEGINQSKALLKVNVRIYGRNLPIRLSFADVKVVAEGRKIGKKRQTFRLGDTVRILSGPFTESTAKIEGINQSRALLKVKVYGRNLKLSFADVKVVTEGRKIGKKRQTFRLGDAVRILSGPFTEFTGRIEGINQSKALLKVKVRISGRNLPIELSFADVKVVS